MLSGLARERAETVFLCSLPGMTSRRLGALLTFYGSPSGVIEALRRGKAAAPPDQECWSTAAGAGDPEQGLEELSRSGISVVVRGERTYPALLEETADPPWALFYRGSLPKPGAPPVAVVGSRKATPYGLEVARWLAGELGSAGAVVISGAASGIDSAAHLGCLRSGGFTVSVLGCGVDVAYPRSSSALIERIGSCGCVMSEYPPGTQPARWRFPERNRIIAGLSRVLVVVEASESSGAMLTVDFALAEGRDVMAVPGQLGVENSAGTNGLIKNGALIVTGPEDVLSELGIEGARTTAGGRDSDTAEGLAERKLARELARGARCAEELSAACRLSAAETLSALTRLEVSGEVLRGQGGLYQITLG